MYSIFFDLETSDRDPIGQILNYSFIVVDENFTQLEECKGTIGLTPLQAPSLGALLANRTLILDYKAQFTEREASSHIDAFLRRHTESGTIGLIGYNSFKFDIQFLRTVLIRNGINPYYDGNLVYRDLYPAVQYLACNDQRFKIPPDANGKPSLSLEAVAKSFGLLSGVQTHESHDDVVLEIALAKYLLKNFGLNVMQWDPYQARMAHQQPRGTLLHQLIPDREKGGAKRVPVILIDYDHKNSLWIDLDRYQKNERHLTLGKIQGGHLFVSEFQSDNPLERVCLEPVIRSALDKYRDMNLGKYFKRKTDCDIEQFIYRVDFAGIEMLNRALHHNDESGIRKANSKDLSILLTRAKLASSPGTAGYADKLLKYGGYRYGGKQMLLSLFRDDEPLRYAESKAELLDSVSKPRADPHDDEIRRQLAEYYKHAQVLKFDS